VSGWDNIMDKGTPERSAPPTGASEQSDVSQNLNDEVNGLKQKLMEYEKWYAQVLQDKAVAEESFNKEYDKLCRDFQATNNALAMMHQENQGLQATCQSVQAEKTKLQQQLAHIKNLISSRAPSEDLLADDAIRAKHDALFNDIQAFVMKNYKKIRLGKL
jgi:predicted  nucleic acid-binding Zn-ribbon protein